MAREAATWEVGPAEENRAYELVGQMASTGEQLALALAAAGEVAAWRQVRERSEPNALHEMCMRAVAEAQCLFVIGTGHALANVALRALALDSERRTELITKFRKGSSSPTFAVFSERPADWPPMNRGTCEKLRAVAESSGASEIIELIDPWSQSGRAWRGTRLSTGAARTSTAGARRRMASKGFRERRSGRTTAQRGCCALAACSTRMPAAVRTRPARSRPRRCSSWDTGWRFSSPSCTSQAGGWVAPSWLRGTTAPRRTFGKRDQVEGLRRGLTACSVLATRPRRSKHQSSSRTAGERLAGIGHDGSRRDGRRTKRAPGAPRFPLRATRRRLKRSCRRGDRLPPRTTSDGRRARDRNLSKQSGPLSHGLTTAAGRNQACASLSRRRARHRRRRARRSRCRRMKASTDGASQSWRRATGSLRPLCPVLLRTSLTYVGGGSASSPGPPSTASVRRIAHASGSGRPSG